jgi:hypothetical protein
MQAPSRVDAGQLRDVCGQFEEALLASLLPASLFAGLTTGQASDSNELPSSGTGPELFRQAFAAAIERGGGIGLGVEFARALSGDAK